MVEQTALAIRKPNSIIHDYSDLERAAKAMASSGYFTDSREFNQAAVKIMAGQEMGFGPFASMNGIHIIKGKPGVGANLQAAAVKGSGKYDYKIREITDKVCRLEFFEGKESLGISEFTLEDAKKAGTQNLDRFPRNMLFARAMSNGVKWFTPDVFNGATVYTPEELGAEVNEDGQPINTEWKPADTLAEPTTTTQPEFIQHDLDWANTIKTKKGKLLAELNTDQLKQILSIFATAKAEGKKIDTVELDIIAATELLIDLREHHDENMDEAMTELDSLALRS
jgi:hypothetical protein